ncbi:MAG: MarR family transcriptional regulator [Hyphomicrobiaceae bacterium]|nr:MAG: MarR family transcriptional regulator [Hyphomicrobiaceae bacterium]
MASSTLFAEVAALSGDPGRASMLHALMDGRALTASELARAAGVTPQTASGHLQRLTAVGLLGVHRQGRFRYYRLATVSVARMLESIMLVAAELAPDQRRLSVGPKDRALRKARTCYDHFAGRLGVALADAFIARGYVELTSEAGLLSQAGIAFLADIGINPEPMLLRTKRSKRVLCRPCLDWSERRLHLGGAVGAAICSHSMAKGWTRRLQGTRAVLITVKGERVFADRFGALDLAG